jgi:hypothetical protein
MSLLTLSVSSRRVRGRRQLGQTRRLAEQLLDDICQI